MALADRQPADRVAGKIHRDQRLRRPLPQLEIGAALHDAEQRLPCAAVLRFERRASSAPPSAGYNSIAPIDLAAFAGSSMHSSNCI